MVATRYTVRVGPTAAKHLDKIAGYISQDSPNNAVRFIEELTEAILSLSHFPLRCGIAPEGELRGSVVRQLVYGRYRVLFTVRESEVRVHGIRHASRRPKR